MTYEFSVAIKGSDQGWFADETGSGDTGDRSKLFGVAFDHELVGLSHASQAARRRAGTQETVSFVKPWGAASPQFFHALLTNEMLQLVRFEFWRPGASGEDETIRTIQLTAARVVSVEQYIDGPVERVSDAPQELERIALTFVQMKIEHLPGTTIVEPAPIPSPPPPPASPSSRATVIRTVEPE
jgi:type VI secretion system Hcp family effector